MVTRAGFPECNPIPVTLIGVLIVRWFISESVVTQYPVHLHVSYNYRKRWWCLRGILGTEW